VSGLEVFKHTGCPGYSYTKIQALRVRSIKKYRVFGLYVYKIQGVRARGIQKYRVSGLEVYKNTECPG
jgi:hypothetical protein